MSRLRHGQRLRWLFAGAVSACLVSGTAAPVAHAETLGGEGLAPTTRTVTLLPGADPLPTVKAATWVLADLETGEVLAQKGAHVQRAPASTLKMLTALAVMPHVAPDATYVATTRAATTYGSRVGLRVGRTYTMDQLWYAVFLPSANDAAIAVAEANGGVKRTVREMNAIAHDLRALDTVAKNTNGLDAPGQRSSAYDLALIAREGLSRDDFAHYAGTAKAQFPDVKGKGQHPIYTTNRLLLHRWPGVIGVKTGFTSNAGRTFVGAATRDGRTLLVTLMGIREASEDAARKLLSWGFANADRVEPVGVLVEKGSPLPAPAATPGAASTQGDGDLQPAADPAGGSSGTAAATTAAGSIAGASGMPAGVIAMAVVVMLTVAAMAARHRRRVRSGGGVSAT